MELAVALHGTSHPRVGVEAATFRALSQWLPLHNVDSSWVRLFYPYGKSEDGMCLVPCLQTECLSGETATLTSGTQIRDFMYVRDAGKVIGDLTLSASCGTTNICSGAPITVPQLAKRSADESGRCGLLNVGARPDNLVDPSFVVAIR